MCSKKRKYIRDKKRRKIKLSEDWLHKFFAKHYHFLCVLAYMRDCAEIEDLTDSLLLVLYHNKSRINFFPSPIQAVKDISLSA